jgi:hypothetical protein
MLASRQNRPDRRRVLDRIEGQHLDRLDHVERLAVPTEVRRSTAAGHQLARRRVQQPELLRPPFTALGGARVVNSLMQVKGTRSRAAVT